MVAGAAFAGVSGRRISARAGIPLAWTGHSLRIGLATTARKRGKDAVAIADQGGWARHSWGEG